MTATLPTLEPRDVFADPDAHWAFLTIANDADFEGQHFDRKEVGRPDATGGISKSELKRLRHDEIASTVSAFANTNRDGGARVRRFLPGRPGLPNNLAQAAG